MDQKGQKKEWNSTEKDKKGPIEAGFGKSFCRYFNF